MIVLIAIVGAIFGSYSTIFIYRIPRGESCFGRFFGPKSRCGKCGYIIPTRELIPVLNWIFTLGSCKSCGAKIPKIFLFAEISMVLLFCLSYLTEDFGEFFILRMGLSFILVLIFAIFWQTRTIPLYLSMMLFFFITVYQVLLSNSILPMIFSLSIGIFFACVLYKILELTFSKKDYIFEIIVFILLSSCFFEIRGTAFYFAFILLLLLFLKFFIKNDSFFKFGFLLIGTFSSLSFLNYL
jgi:prepilin signal peptidase PulO-like enzyme (type II secretory pathway)